MSVLAVFTRIISALDQAGIPYMLVGSFASAYHGVSRATQDIDVVIDASEQQLQVLIQRLSGEDYYADLDAALQARQQQSLFNIVDMATGWKIDLIIRKSRAFNEEEFRRRKLVHLQGIELFVASAEDVMISKLEWAKLAESRRQIEDVAAILRIRGNSLDRDYLEKWIDELGLTEEWIEALRAAGSPS